MRLIKFFMNVYCQIIALNYDNMFIKNYDNLFSRHGQVIINRDKIWMKISFIDLQINLYGSISFECCLEKPGSMDIDIQFKQTLQYDTLKELLEIITKSGRCRFVFVNWKSRCFFWKIYVKKPVLIRIINHRVLI
jgi:hypothetical protein